MEPYLNDDDFNRYFKYLQLMSMSKLPNSLRKWEDHTARTSHIDFYNMTINKGEDYYSHTVQNKEVKLSHLSMDKYLYLLFEDAIELQERCQGLQQNEKIQIQKAKSRIDW